MAAEHELSRDVDVDLGGIFASLWQRKFTLLIASLLVTAIVFVLLQVISPRYRSEASILIRSSDAVLTSPATANPARVETSLDEQGIASQVQLLQSRTIARAVIEKLNLKDSAEFNYAKDSSVLGNLPAMLGLSDDTSAVTAEDRVLERYYEKLKVFQAQRARVIVVQFWSKNPKLAAEIPNMIADEYVRLQEELKRGAGPAELEKLEPELAALRKKLINAEAAVADFRASSDIQQGRDNASLATQELSELSSELGRVRGQLSRAEAEASAVQRALQSNSIDTASSVLRSPLIQRLRERQVTLSAQLAERSTTLLPAHPQIQRLQSQISTLTSQINREARKILTSLQADVRVARAREKDLIQRRNTLKAEAGRVDRDQVDLRALERDANVQRSLLEAYEVRFQEARARQAREFLPADAFIFSRAQVSSKAYFPKKLPTLAGAFFGSLLLGSMFTLAGSILSGSAARDRHFESYTDARAKVEPEMEKSSADAQPTAIDAPPMVPSRGNLTEPVEANNVHAASVAASSIGMLGRARIAVLSPEGDGSAEGTIVIARTIAAQGPSVVVLDMSTGSGGVSRSMIGPDVTAGIKDLLTGTVSYGEAIHRDRLSAAHVMPVGAAPDEAAIGSGQRLADVLQALEQAYNYVVVDCGATDISGLSQVSDMSTVNVINAVDPHSSEVQLASDMVVRAGYREPLIVHVSKEERQMAGLIPA